MSRGWTLAAGDEPILRKSEEGGQARRLSPLFQRSTSRLRYLAATADGAMASMEPKASVTGTR
jgi:hypothetical protein